MVDQHGSQCGFCTPGIVMSLFAAYHSGAPATAASLNDAACRQSLPLHRLPADPGGGRSRPATARRPTGSRRRPSERAAALAALADGRDLFVGDEARFFAAPGEPRRRSPTSPRRFPDATLVAGATDVGLWVTKQLRDLERVIWLGRVAGLDAVGETADGALRLGAGVTLARRRAASRRRSIPTSAK